MILVALILGLIVLSLVIYLLDSTFGGLDFTTSDLAIMRISEIIKTRHLESAKFYDLGSCRGKFAMRLAKALPDLHIYGVDNDWFRIMPAKIRSLFFKNLTFKKGNIFNENLSSADIVYLYLPQELMPNLQDKLQKELNPEALVITNRVSFPSWQPVESLILNKDNPKSEKIFVYSKMNIEIYAKI